MKTPVAILTALLVFGLIVPPATYADPPEQDQATALAVPARTSDRPIRELAVSPEELGANWLVIPESVQELDIEHLGRAPRPSDPLALFQARYLNETDYQPGRETAFLVAEFQDQEQAAIALHEYLDYIILGSRLPEVRWRWHAEGVATGDDGVRFGYCLREAFTAGYLFRIDTYLAGVLIKGPESDEEDLLAEVTTVAGLQEAHVTSEALVALAVR